MTTIKSRFDAYLPSSTLDISPDTTDMPWLSTYSRALCSLYPKEEDDCWDVLLSCQPSTVFAKLSDVPISSASPSSQSSIRTAAQSRHRRHRHHHHHHHHHHHSHPIVPQCNTSKPVNATISSTLSYSLPHEPAPAADTIGDNEVEKLRLAPVSPGSGLSHALCSFGFDWIDYFAPIETDDEPISQQIGAYKVPATASPSSCSTRCTTADQLMEVDTGLTGDQDSDWAAAVCGKRTAALERRRVLSRISSLENAVSDPWFETLDRLSRWEEVAYR